MLSINLNSAIPLHEQIKSGLRELLLKGQLKAGDPLPQTQELAASLLVSPHVVSRAYNELVKERFLEHRHGSGPVISANARNHTSKEIGETVQQLIMTLQASRNGGLSWEDIESIVQLIRREECRDEQQVIPAIFKRLYFERGVSPTAEALCPYCRESVTNDAVSCLLCKTRHHAECWQETGRCSVFGCKGEVNMKSGVNARGK